MAIDYSERIPNNVDLNEDRRLQRALEGWQPAYLDWWQDLGPADASNDEIYLRTAIDVDKKGWARFGFVRMPEYRWGVFLAEPEPDRTIPFGDHAGAPVWQTVPGEYRTQLRRLIVTQGDTEPASVEQQRHLGATCPSLYDLRNLFQVNVEEGRHLWAMVYLLHAFFGRDGREEADELLHRHSGDPDRPRILGAFNEPTPNWLAYFMFTFFTDRDGKYQLAALAESGFDPLARSTQFMLTEEAYHLQTGENGVGRTIHRTAELLKQGKDPRAEGAFPLDLIQRYINFWSSASFDLFGGEDSTNAAEAFASGLKGRYREGDGIYKDPQALNQFYTMERPEGDRMTTQEIPLRRAMNALLLDAYVADCKRIVNRWQRDLTKFDLGLDVTLPSQKFNRRQGVYSEHYFTPEGELTTEADFEKHRDEWLPTTADRECVQSCMIGVQEPGKIANWISPPARGVNEQPFDFEYVKLN